MRPPFNGEWPVLAGWRYSSGGGHFAYDYAMPIGTDLFAVGDGKILGCNGGVPNDTPWDPDYSGEPSNWILLGTRFHGRKVSVLYQHLSPDGLKVHTGQKVKEGQYLGNSGNSGNTSGPHLHLAAMWGWWAEATRYIYMQNDGDNPYVIFPPSRLWRADMALSDQDKRDIADMTADLVVRRLMAEPIYGKDATKAEREVTFRRAQRAQYEHSKSPATP